LDPNDPWAIPRHATKGESSEEAIYVGVGRALDTWERFESTLGWLYGAVIDPGRHNRAAARAFGSLAAFSARADQLEQAAKVHFAERPNLPVERQFKTLLHVARRASPRRNDIAHGQVWFLSRGLREGWEGGYYLGPASYNARRHAMDGEPLFTYSRAELDDFTKRFELLWIAANELFNAICHGLPMQPVELLPRSTPRPIPRPRPYPELSRPQPSPSQA
jgi:hypothetical protein